MNIKQLDDIVTDLIRWEGIVPWMYLDTKGNVTTGIGMLLADDRAACELPFFNSRKRPATNLEIRFDFMRVQEVGQTVGTEPRRSAHYYRSPASVEMVTGDCRAAAIARLEREFVPGLVKVLPLFERFPTKAQAALLDMAWNMGIGRPAGDGKKATGLRQFPTMLGACEAGDWATAAIECRRAGVREERNEWTKALFLAADGIRGIA